MIVKKVLSTTLFKTCVVRKEIVAVDDNDPGTEWKAAYSVIDGSYIGNCKNADFFERKGIFPQAITGNKVASIGFCEKEQKWYGWSHRAMYGFSIGSMVKKGNCAYQPMNPRDMVEDMIRFWVDDEDEFVTKTKILQKKVDAKDPNKNRGGLGILLKTERTRKKDGKILTSTYWDPYPSTWGKGEWKAKTLEDAKEMAINFARSVS